MDIITQRLEFQVGESTHKAYLAFDEQSGGAQPGVLVLHEWWGLNDNIHRRVHMLAELGYAAMAIDLFGEGRVAANPDEAGAMMNAALGDLEHTGTILQQGYQLMQSQTVVDENRTAAIGYCFGGAMALHCARMGLPLSAVASFHGALGATREISPGDVNAKMLICQGEADSMATLADLEGFKAEMDAAGANYEVITYAGAKHGFTNPEADTNAEKYGLDLGYNQQADEQSWQAMQDFFNRTFYV